MKTEPTLTTGDLSIVYHTSIIGSDGETNSLWFSDAEDMICGVQRKLGVEIVDGLVERANEIGLDVVHAVTDPADDRRLLLAKDEAELDRLARISVARQAILDGLLPIPTFDPTLIGILLDSCPAAVGEIAFTTAVDRKSRPTAGILASIRAGIHEVDTPALVAARCGCNDADWLRDAGSSVRSFSPASGDFVITFQFLEGESEIDAYVTIGDAILHTRDVGSRPFDLMVFTD